MEQIIYNQEGKKAGSVTLNEALWNLPWNADLVHQVVESMRSNARTPVAHVKDRSEVSGGGKKPWQQKGTGRARHGSSRSPIWRHGGVTHGPTNEKNFDKKINRKMRAKALFTVLSAKLRHGEVLFVESIAPKEMKTSAAKEVLTSLASLKGFDKLMTKRKNAAILTIPERDTVTEKSYANFGHITLDRVQHLNPVDALNAKFLVITHPKESVTFLEGRLQ